MEKLTKDYINETCLKDGQKCRALHLASKSSPDDGYIVRLSGLAHCDGLRVGPTDLGRSYVCIRYLIDLAIKARLEDPEPIKGDTVPTLIEILDESCACEGRKGFVPVG